MSGDIIQSRPAFLKNTRETICNVVRLSIHWIIKPLSYESPNLSEYYSSTKKQNVTRFVDTLIGTANGDGHVFPGPCHPFGVVKLGFDTDQIYDFNAGYTTTGKITGISHLHVSGTGGEAKYGVISQFPVVDSIKDPLQLDEFSSERSFEHFEVGYSKFGLKRYNITVELTASRRTGLHRYNFPSSKNKARIIIDLPHNLYTRGYGFTHKYLGGSIQSISLNHVKGAGRYSGGWNRGGPYIVYFCSQFNVNATEFETWKSKERYQTTYFDGTTYFGEINGAILTFNITENPVIISRVGISFISVDQACKSAESEIPDWNFEKTMQEAVKAWQMELEKIYVEGGTDDLKTIFYSSLYRTLIIPSDRTGENPKWKSVDKNGNLIPHYGDFYCLWDTFRTTNPLFTLFQQERAVDIVRALIDIYKNEGFMPDGRSGLENGITQGGSNADMVVSETYLKKLGTNLIDWDLAYEALIKDAEVDPKDRGLFEGRLFLSPYKKYGYIPYSEKHKAFGTYATCSRTIEYSANDYSISLVAKGLGKYEDYMKYKKRAKNWENLWHSNLTFNGTKGFIVPRYENGTYYTKLDVLNSLGNNIFYEGTSWQYSLDIPFDVKRLIELSGGPKFFEERLDKTFSDKSYQSGYYNIGNEPVFFHICLYHFIGKQYKSVDVIRDILKTKFGSGPDGVPGNDDSGAMGSWFAFNAIGLYPLAGTDIYLINSPHFDRVTINLSSRIKLTILAYNLTTEEDQVNPYVQSVKINGINWRKTWFRHSDIAKGAIMELFMGSNPSKVLGVIEENEDKFDIEDRVVPPSMSNINI
ncbi:Glycoside Hydrolase Family 92 protein [Gigaspora rosea]|uniref:Glycoside Hydrolase Family 92 protein n=1 Tax=Gigaspora rosea TaxID=44941 RepID=A0A397UQR1_9GLOM|nr:Glycoside Hydrolase Family 92 protein [Gigaspora rosea]